MFFKSKALQKAINAIDAIIDENKALQNAIDEIKALQDAKDKEYQVMKTAFSAMKDALRLSPTELKASGQSKVPLLEHSSTI